MRNAIRREPARAPRTTAGTAVRGFAVLLGALLLVAGCGRSALIEVEGHVTLDGVPLEDGTIEFTPANGAGPTAGGLIAKGSYKVPAMAGEKQVRIQGFRVIGREHHRGDPNNPLMDIKETIVPRKYNAETTLAATIDPEHRTIDFSLEGH